MRRQTLSIVVSNSARPAFIPWTHVDRLWETGLVAEAVDEAVDRKDGYDECSEGARAHEGD